MNTRCFIKQIQLPINSFMVCLCLLIMVWTASPLLAQINGTVTDSKTGKPVKGVVVFINGTTLASRSNDEGVFVLSGWEPGFADLVMYRKGYKLFKSSIHLQEGKAYAVHLAIDPAPRKKSKRSPGNNSEEGLQQLKDALVGRENDASTILMNVETLSLTGETHDIVVRAQEPLVINNFLLGYQMRYYLQEGTLTSGKAELSGFFFYLPMIPKGSAQEKEWAEERMKLYRGSLRHFLKSLTTGNARHEGYYCFTARGDSIDERNLAVPSSVPGYYKLMLPDTLVVVNVSPDADKLTSQLISKAPLAANRDGNLLKPEDLVVGGSMGRTGAIMPLPNNYEPKLPKEEDFARFYEKTYVQTDKPYYYPGEPLWFKGYINYLIPAWRDSLCRVMHVELINARKEITQSRTLRIDSGFFLGDFILPDTIPSGPYYLRAYTNLNRNFGSHALFIMPVPVLKITDKAVASQGDADVPVSGLLTITPDKSSYRTREKISLVLQVKDTTGIPMASNLSLSVTDANQVAAMQGAGNIMTEFPFSGEMKLPNMDFEFGAEFGVSFIAKFLNNKGEPESTTLDIVQLKTGQTMVAESDQEGVFWHSGLQFYDTVQFAFKPDKARGRAYGKVQLLKQESPEVDFRGIRMPIEVKDTEIPQRLVSEYEIAKSAHLLDAVTVRASKLDYHQATDDGKQQRISFEKVPQDFQVLKIPGYTRPRAFRSPDYDDPKTDKDQPDYRATIYWNPWITTLKSTGTASVTFFSADLEGRYRVVAEGVTTNGQPVRSVKYITITNR